MKKTPDTTRATGAAQRNETSKTSIESRLATRKPADHTDAHHISLTDPATRAAVGRVLRQMMGGCHG